MLIAMQVAAIMVAILAILLAFVPTMSRDGRIVCAVIMCAGVLVMLFGGISLRVGG